MIKIIFFSESHLTIAPRLAIPGSALSEKIKASRKIHRSNLIYITPGYGQLGRIGLKFCAYANYRDAANKTVSEISERDFASRTTGIVRGEINFSFILKQCRHQFFPRKISYFQYKVDRFRENKIWPIQTNCEFVDIYTTYINFETWDCDLHGSKITKNKSRI